MSQTCVLHMYRREHIPAHFLTTSTIARHINNAWLIQQTTSQPTYPAHTHLKYYAHTKTYNVMLHLSSKFPTINASTR